MQLPTIAALTLFAFPSLGLAGTLYTATCDPAPTSDYWASYLAWAELNCQTAEYSGSAGIWHADTAKCEAPDGVVVNTQRYYHPVFSSASGAPNITPSCYWAQG